MSEQMAWLIENGIAWEKTLGERDAILEDARQILRTVKAEAKRLREADLRTELHRRNWRHDEKGRWTPPKVHRLPPDNFDLGASLAKEGESQ